MRTLTADELTREMITRLGLRFGRRVFRIERDLIALVAEMIELSREAVPECYEQATAIDECPIGVGCSGCDAVPLCSDCHGTGYVSTTAGEFACGACLGRR